VQVRAGDESYWLQLDSARRGLLDRYIRLTRAGLLSETPTLLQVLAAVAHEETVEVEIERYVFEGPSIFHGAGPAPAEAVIGLWQAAQTVGLQQRALPGFTVSERPAGGRRRAAQRRRTRERLCPSGAAA
jgi:hypothetical protein